MPGICQALLFSTTFGGGVFVGPQEMLDRAEIENKWMLTPMKYFKSPRLTARIWRTPLAVMITALIYNYLFPGRNPCFALIGAAYGVGSQFEEGFHNGINRFIGTFVGGFLVIPFYWLYFHQPFGIPNWIWLVIGLCLVLWCSLAMGADSAIQPGMVVYFVVIFMVGEENVASYAIARVIDTGIGVFLSLLLTMILPSHYDKEKGLTFRTFWTETKYSFRTYLYNNRKNRQKEQENFGMSNVEKAGDRPDYPGKNHSTR